jgi:hypothetical protein
MHGIGDGRGMTRWGQQANLLASSHCGGGPSIRLGGELKHSGWSSKVSCYTSEVIHLEDMALSGSQGGFLDDDNGSESFKLVSMRITNLLSKGEWSVGFAEYTEGE